MQYLSFRNILKPFISNIYNIRIRSNKLHSKYVIQTFIVSKLLAIS